MPKSDKKHAEKREYNTLTEDIMEMISGKKSKKAKAKKKAKKVSPHGAQKASRAVLEGSRALKAALKDKDKKGSRTIAGGDELDFKY
jgi:hypothetical protein